jgi:hypothetical protein
MTHVSFLLSLAYCVSDRGCSEIIEVVEFRRRSLRQSAHVCFLEDRLLGEVFIFMYLFLFYTNLEYKNLFRGVHTKLT